MVVEFYEITMNHGTATPYESQTVVSDTQIKYQIVEFERVTITASEIAGKIFDHWEASNPNAQNDIADRTASTTTYGNYYGDVTITAVYTEPINYLDKDGLTTLVANIKNELATRDSQITALQNENAELLDQIPTGEATGELINLQDSSNLPIKDFAMLGNATQDSTPTPSTPQDIHVVTGNVTYKQYGKNILNFQDTTKYIPTTKTILSALSTGIRATQRTSGTYSSAYFLIENYEYLKGKELKIVATITPSASNNGDIRIYGYTSGTLGERITVTDGVFTIPANFNYDKIAILFYSNTNGTGNEDDYVDYTNLRVIVNSTNDSYEPYTEQTQLISLGSIELAKIGDYTDRIFKQDGKWYVYKTIGNVVLDGSEDWLAQGSSADYYEYRINNGVENSGTNKQNEVKTNYFNQTTNSRVMINNAKTIYLRFPTSSGIDISTLELFKTWLSTHNTIVYYVLATPPTTEITDETLISQLENILAMHTNRNVTNAWIEPSGTNAQASSTLTYYLDLATITNNLQNQIDIIST